MRLEKGGEGFKNEGRGQKSYTWKILGDKTIQHMQTNDLIPDGVSDKSCYGIVSKLTSRTVNKVMWSIIFFGHSGHANFT